MVEPKMTMHVIEAALNNCKTIMNFREKKEKLIKMTLLILNELEQCSI